MESPSTLNQAADFGKIEYLESMSIMDRAIAAVRNGKIPNVALFFRYPPVYTVGRGKKPENYKNVEVVEVDRGGDVTYHGPGQLICYPIIDLRSKLDVRSFVKNIENVIISSLHKVGYEAYVGEEPGIWVNGKKVASIGMAIRDGISAHGFAINISPDVLDGFKKIKACGLEPDVMGYIDVDENELIKEIVENLSKFYGRFNFLDKNELLELL